MGGAGSLESVFPGPSAMAALLRGRGWSSSPLGSPAGWPPGLQTACRICLTSRFPVGVWWGPDLRFIYNDAYLPLLGTKHPALDMPGADVWSETWHIIGPMLHGVLETGRPTWSEDLPLPMNRHGYWEETYWRYSYSPLHDDQGAVRGVFTAVTDTTERVISQRRLSVLQDLGAQAGTAHTVEADQVAHLLDRQREVALARQHAIVGPGRTPAGFAVRCEPATPPPEIGGVWCDIAELASGRIAIIIGDCVGRGLAAASVMAQLRSACRGLLPQSEGPAQVLTALDRFAALIPDARCSTVFCGILDTATGCLSYASAGHPPGILARPDGTVELLDQGRSFPLALSPDSPRRVATTYVPYGATLLLYTDRLIERRRPIDAGTAQASALLQAGREMPVDELAEQIMTDFAPGQGHEGVAILLYSRPAPLDLAFPADPHKLAEVRQQLRGWLRPLSLNAILAHDVLIAACEACANAIEHGYRDFPGGTVRLRVEVSGADVRITVADTGSWRPPRQVPYRGNGLNTMRATMQDVTITAGDSGTTIEMRAKTP
jgi:anti-sigma regulatory factor (Ser/Thr protein kinase)